MNNVAFASDCSFLLVRTADACRSVRLTWREQTRDPAGELPAPLRDEYAQQLQSVLATLRYNGPRAKPWALRDEGGCLELQAGPFTYAQARAIQKILAVHPFVLDEADRCVQPDPLLTSSTGMNLYVISSDGQLLTLLRSKTLQRHPGVWCLGLGEGLEPDDFAQASEAPLERIGRRILREELGFETSEARLPLECLALVVERPAYVWAFLTVVDFRRLPDGPTAEQLRQLSVHAPDAWEHDDLRFQPLEQCLQGEGVPEGSPTHPLWATDITLLRQYEASRNPQAPA